MPPARRASYRRCASLLSREGNKVYANLPHQEGRAVDGDPGTEVPAPAT